MRARRIPTVLLAIAVVGTFFIFLRQNLTGAYGRAPAPQPKGPEPLVHEPVRPVPRPLNGVREHPIDLLVKDSERDFRAMLDRQSQTLEEAVENYKKRYGMSPPPSFDVWYKFAKKKRVQILDDYDTIHHSMLPFWGLQPATIRARVREALGFDGNALIAIMIRDGKVTHRQAGPEWQQTATIGMMEEFIQYLPDMDLAFNIHDEPRVVVPHDELNRLVILGKSRQSESSPKPKRKQWSPRPQDLQSGLRVLEVKTTRFNVFAHQPVWLPSRLSCSIDTPARALEESHSLDDLSKYAFSSLGFIHNHTAFTDVCNTPSLASSHGFFDRPNAFNVVHDLVPIFSQSKMSSFQDILYPSPWYWSERVHYDSHSDPPWTSKLPKLWWVGSTTGGFSRNGGWRRQHRQKVVTKLNALDNAQIMQNRANIDRKEIGGEDPEWSVKDVQREEFKELMDVHFSHIGQCDPGDCDAQREFFHVVKAADFQTAWKHKFLLDIDGNAFSGRFYAFLKSKSLPIKMSVFREWHEEWIKPWVHFVPLSLRADEGLEVVRYLSGEDEGRRTAERLAEEGRMWAEKTLRNEDFEVWFFRLLLEYARVIDDERENIGFEM
ncbi:Cytochrome c peroxidase, mitochondrial [Sphaceloma murrayae]|uniref:Cytochrome c peroxidase, mitochondrial n=1 Tax=Sphaceloma murrayae TaxID=2082308 RepID=A0A2K1QLI0_9PEZI|nr:Cytochrome c peroxidase, mitochondrial [Sphaceloma murrayae]